MTELETDNGFEEGRALGYREGFVDGETEAQNAFRDGYDTGVEDGVPNGMDILSDHITAILDNAEVPESRLVRNYRELFDRIRSLVNVNSK